MLKVFPSQSSRHFAGWQCCCLLAVPDHPAPTGREEFVMVRWSPFFWIVAGRRETVPRNSSSNDQQIVMYIRNQELTHPKVAVGGFDTELRAWGHMKCFWGPIGWGKLDWHVTVNLDRVQTGSFWRETARTKLSVVFCNIVRCLLQVSTKGGRLQKYLDKENWNC